MRRNKNYTSGGVIIFHTPLPVSVFKSEECRADVREPAARRGSPAVRGARTRSPGTCARVGGRDEEAPPCGAQPGAKQERLSHASLRRLKAKMEADRQQLEEIIQPLLDTQRGLVKDLERFLRHRDVTELRRRELLHKRWTERVWFPLQRRLEEHASSRGPTAAKRRQSLYGHYLHHCNTKGSVFLETYDVREYNPLLLQTKKRSTADLKDPLYLQLHEGLKGKRTAGSCEGCRYTRRQVEMLSQRDPPLSESATPRTAILRLASSNHPVTASRNPPVGDETEGRRLERIPYYFSANANADGRCHESSCWLLGFGQQPAS
ncbi:protein FAM228A [Pseudoliparis swirei]|uniref:protein FAM228A n=1 Tax=Pseudoliparis swirei TaxID=2059687 RepID=UPI0024BE6B0F|nr:protein FAM228A [Pseudoliparis swirei]